MRPLHFVCELQRTVITCVIFGAYVNMLYTDERCIFQPQYHYHYWLIGDCAKGLSAYKLDKMAWCELWLEWSAVKNLHSAQKVSHHAAPFNLKSEGCGGSMVVHQAVKPAVPGSNPASLQPAGTWNSLLGSQQGWHDNYRLASEGRQRQKKIQKIWRKK